MGTMTVNEIGWPVELVGTFTLADLDATPDDGQRYELIDGAMFVSPSPIIRHQFILRVLYDILNAATPNELVVQFGPVDVALDESTRVVPDLVVARWEDFGEKDLPVAPLLAVEILSHSTRRYDQTKKLEKYADAGVASYWLIDPIGPNLVAYELHDGVYVEIANVSGDETFNASAPFPVAITPSSLLDR